MNRIAVTDFAAIETEFLRRVNSVVWCSAATIATNNRPRSRILHPYWEGSTGWITTRPQSHKARHLAHNPYMSLAYVQDVARPVYVDCHAAWVQDLEDKRRIWETLRNTPPPMGFDPGTMFISADDPGFGLLRLTPWRIEVSNFPTESHIWHA